MSTLLEQWRDTAYSKEMDKASLQKFWEPISRLKKRSMKSCLRIRTKK